MEVPIQLICLYLIKSSYISQAMQVEVQHFKILEIPIIQIGGTT